MIKKLTGEYLTNDLTSPVSEQARNNFIMLMKSDERIQGTPNYDGYGYWVLENKGWDSCEKDEYYQVK